MNSFDNFYWPIKVVKTKILKTENVLLSNCF